MLGGTGNRLSPERHRGEHLSHVGVDQALTGRSGDGDPVMAVSHEVQAADAIDLDRRDCLAAPLGEGQPLPPVPHPGGGRPEAPVEVAPGADCADDGIQPNNLQAQLPLAAPAQRADDLIQWHEPVVVAAAAQAMHQRGQELAPPGPQKIILHICPWESRIQIRPPSGRHKISILRYRCSP